MASATCDFCGQQIKVLGKINMHTKDGKYCCLTCMNKTGVNNVRELQSMTAAEVENRTKDIIMKCNICDKVFSYTYADLQKNKQYANAAVVESISGLFGSAGASAIKRNNANNHLNKIVDYNRCPNCNSTDLRKLSMEEFQKEKQLSNTSQTSAHIISSADELKKYKELLDSGVITEEEFNTKKKQLLGL